MKSLIEINASALRNNLRIFTKLAGQAQVAPVLKANAYGHGFRETYLSLKDEIPNQIVVNYLAEAQELRNLGYEKAIIIVGPISPNELNLARACQAGVTIGDKTILESWVSTAERPKAHIKFDTGMGRQGFAPDEAPQLAYFLKSNQGDVIGISSHFANVEDVTEHEYADRQIRLFKQSLAAFRDQGFNVKAHIGSSASTLILTHSLFDIVRVGISLYGLWPSQATRLSYLKVHDDLAKLQPALRWQTEIASIKTIKKGQFVGYGCSYRTTHDMLIGVLPVGYYEGYPRLAGEKGAYVLVNGIRCPILGRICMNMMMIDLTHLDQVKAHDPVTLIGHDQGETIEAHSLATWAETIHYELLSRLHHEIPRRLL